MYIIIKVFECISTIVIQIIILKENEVICLFKTKELSKPLEIMYDLKTYSPGQYCSAWRKLNPQNIFKYIKKGNIPKEYAKVLAIKCPDTHTVVMYAVHVSIICKDPALLCWSQTDAQK